MSEQVEEWYSYAGMIETVEGWRGRQKMEGVEKQREVD